MDMARPTNGSWRIMKNLGRYMVGCDRIVWRFCWQSEVDSAAVFSDSDWGGTCRDRRSTSGGIWMLGSHCIKTWSVKQNAYALSSAEAELYALVEESTRAKGILTLAKELGFGHLSNGIVLATDSSAAKQFVSRQGLGKMRHLQIRDLWLQREVSEGRIKVVKVKGDHNPADLLTKVLSVQV